MAAQSDQVRSEQVGLSCQCDFTQSVRKADFVQEANTELLLNTQGTCLICSLPPFPTATLSLSRRSSLSSDLH